MKNGRIQLPNATSQLGMLNHIKHTTRITFFTTVVIYHVFQHCRQDNMTAQQLANSVTLTPSRISEHFIHSAKSVTTLVICPEVYSLTYTTINKFIWRSTFLSVRLTICHTYEASSATTATLVLLQERLSIK